MASTYEEWKAFGGKILAPTIVVTKRKRLLDVDQEWSFPNYDQTHDEPVLEEDLEAQHLLGELMIYDKKELNHYKEMEDIDLCIKNIDVISNCHHSEPSGSLSLTCW